MSSITTILGSDLITNSRTVINTNFSNLNTDKIETSTLDTDTTLSANSDAKIATQKAVKAYVDAGGNVNASTTSKGIVEEATDAEVAAGTAVGGTGARLFVSPGSFVALFTGILSPYAGRTAPTGWLLCDGTAVSRSTYANLKAVIAPAKVFTVSIASPGVFSCTAHGLVIGDKISLTTTGALPTGLAVNTDYFIISAGLTADAFEVSATRGGAVVNTSGSQSGVHTFHATIFGKGDGSTTFNLPDMRGMTAYGYNASDANFDALNIPNTYVGSKTHTLTEGQLPPHTHAARQRATGVGSLNNFAVTALLTDGATVNSIGSSGNNPVLAGADQSGSSHNNMPPYGVFNWIIKI